MLKSTKRAFWAAAASLPLLAGSAWADGLISIIVTDPANPYWFTEGEVAKATALELGYEATVSAHTGDTNIESNLIDAAITNGAAAIILDPANADGSVGVVRKATEAGIPVFLVNAEINESGIAIAQLVSNNAQGAALGAIAWQELVGEDASYVEFFGNPIRQQRRHPFQRLQNRFEPISRTQTSGPRSGQLGPHARLHQNAVHHSSQPRHRRRDFWQR
jgi:erythritol transport system substrate-binding protein